MRVKIGTAIINQQTADMIAYWQRSDFYMLNVHIDFLSNTQDYLCCMLDGNLPESEFLKIGSLLGGIVYLKENLKDLIFDREISNCNQTSSDNS